MTLIFFDDQARETLLPLTFTKPVCEIRVGILTIGEKWQKYLNTEEKGCKTADYLQQKYPFRSSSDNLFINGSICPDEELLEAVDKLKDGQVLVKDAVLIAARVHEAGLEHFDVHHFAGHETVSYGNDFTRIVYPEHIFGFNPREIRKDFALLTKGRTSAPISSTNTILGDQIFAEEGFEAECSVFNATFGPMYFGKNSQVWENSAIRGSFALCDNSQVKMGARIYSGTTIGPYCRVGGEINNAVLQAYSSKGHDGYLGNSVLGEWCNIGADSNNSNLKNTYAEVRLWDYQNENFRKTGMQNCGLIMADHAKCAINTMFNTGTVVGVSANVFGAGFPRHFVPDFSWGGAQGFSVYSLNKMFETAEKVFERRDKVFDETEKAIITKVFELTEKYRRFY